MEVGDQPNQRPCMHPINYAIMQAADTNTLSSLSLDNLGI